MAYNRRAEAWKSVYERMLECQSVHPSKERGAWKELADALKLANTLDREEDEN
jgi:hypothetical protein